MKTQRLGTLSKDLHDVQELWHWTLARDKQPNVKVGPEKEAAFIRVQGTFEIDGK